MTNGGEKLTVCGGEAYGVVGGAHRILACAKCFGIKLTEWEKELNQSQNDSELPFEFKTTTSIAIPATSCSTDITNNTINVSTLSNNSFGSMKHVSQGVQGAMKLGQNEVCEELTQVLGSTRLGQRASLINIKR